MKETFSLSMKGSYTRNFAKDLTLDATLTKLQVINSGLKEMLGMATGSWTSMQATSRRPITLSAKHISERAALARHL